MTPDPVHSVISEAVTRTPTERWVVPLRYASAVAPPAGRILPSASEISRR